MLGHAILPMPSPPGSGLKPSPPGSGLKPSPPGSGLKPSPPGSGLKPSPPGSGLKPTESVDTADSGQTEEVATAHGNHAEVPEDEVGEEGRALHDQQELVVGLQPQVEQEDEIPEEGGSKDTGVCSGLYIHACMCICKWALCVCACVLGSMYVRVYVCMYVYMYIGVYVRIWPPYSRKENL